MPPVSLVADCCTMYLLDCLPDATPCTAEKAIEMVEGTAKRRIADRKATKCSPKLPAVGNLSKVIDVSSFISALSISSSLTYQGRQMTRFATASKKFGYFDNDELLDRIGNDILNEYIGKIQCFLNANGSMNNWSKHSEITPHIKVHRPISAALKTYIQNRMPISIKPRFVSNLRKHT